MNPPVVENLILFFGLTFSISSLNIFWLSDYSGQIVPPIPDEIVPPFKGTCKAKLNIY